MTTDQEILTELAELRENDTTDYGCPDWCQRDDHCADVVDADNPPMHYGPEFGVFWAQARTGEPFHVETTLPDMLRGGPGKLNGTKALLMIARDALGLAEWLVETRA